MRFFNTAGPCRPEWHYTVESLHRLPEVRSLIEERHYFVIHAPRQTGKTTYLYALMYA
ncbi:MAG: ATP-binding protein, partial [Pseudomonadota bacterium]